MNANYLVYYKGAYTYFKKKYKDRFLYFFLCLLGPLGTTRLQFVFCSNFWFPNYFYIVMIHLLTSIFFCFFVSQCFLPAIFLYYFENTWDQLCPYQYVWTQQNLWDLIRPCMKKSWTHQRFYRSGLRQRLENTQLGPKLNKKKIEMDFIFARVNLITWPQNLILIFLFFSLTCFLICSIQYFQYSEIFID